MRLIDTNVILRFILNDNAEMAKRAAEAIASGAYTKPEVIAEVVYVLKSVYSTIYTDKMEFHVIELPKLPKELQEDCSNIELWARFINAESKEEFDMIAQRDPYIDSAYQKLQVISQDRDMRMEYEAREKAIRDFNEGMLEAEERGEVRGRKAEAISIARNLVCMGYPTEEIVKITLLPEEEIEGLY